MNLFLQQFNRPSNLISQKRVVKKRLSNGTNTPKIIAAGNCMPPSVVDIDFLFSCAI
jgi:hypothetical protein